jgi:NAD-dependent dihydropyrimidine dehydrogenase PreA subunit
VLPSGRASSLFNTVNPAQMTYVIAAPCIGEKDASCVAVCPVDCIYESGDQYFIHPGECIDCGACEPECPVQAIYPEEDIPEEYRSFIQVNRDLVAEL